MQNFIDTVTQRYWAFDSDVEVSNVSGVYSFSANGTPLDVPTTLTPCSAQVETPAQVQAAAWAAYQGNALAALADSDITVLRCYENAVSVPTAWTAYRAALRIIVSSATGDATAPFPVRPSYPAGT